MSSATITIVREAELRSPRQHGHRIRAFCPVHGGDRQRSLSIEAPGGEYAGYGYCHTCHTTVFVPELNPDEEARRARGQGRGPSAPRRITPAALLRPVARQAEGEPTPEGWQRAELEALTRLYPRMRERLADDRARAYLEGRGIPWEIADGAGVGYLPADVPTERRKDPDGKTRLYIARTSLLAKWRDRLILPLGSPAGIGYYGRTLWGWQPGMDENAHKALLEADPTAPHRHEKTYPAGWWNYDALASASSAVLVEGAFDALALMAAGLLDAPVIALVGTAGRAHWIPDSVARVVLALDGDGPGQTAARDLAHELRASGLVVTPCAPPLEDGQGKDWAERWRLAEWEGVAPVFDALDAPAASPEPSHSVTPAAPIPCHIVPESDDTPAENLLELAPHFRIVAPSGELAAEALEDPVVHALRTAGYALASVTPPRPTGQHGYFAALADLLPGQCFVHEYAKLRGPDGQRWCINCHSPEAA